MKNRLHFSMLLAVALFIISGCNRNPGSSSGNFEIPYEKFTLDNGLEVVFHIDRSDPVVSVNMTCHVGSSRELPGRTGFAHLFEHLLFNESENLGRGGLDNLSARVGGNGANGSTSQDRTNYFQTVPSDALEKMLWAEADKLGWFINTVTEPVLAKEKQVVKNEKRQSVDNRPYGHTSHVISSNLYPADHPYSWTVIGSLDDLSNATLQDVKDFYKRWYVPNNVTLVVAGDFDPEQAREWVEKYFGEIPRGEEIEPRSPAGAQLDETRLFYHEDNLARLPELNMVWPATEEYHPDSYALDILANYLSQGKRAPLYKVLVEEKQLTSGARMSNRPAELAGEVYLSVRAFSNVDLDNVIEGINQAFAAFEEDGIPQRDLDRIKAGMESGFYNRLSSTLGKANQMALYNIFAGDPGYAGKEIEKMMAVTSDDVMRVYREYIAGKPYVATSFVPAGSESLALAGSIPAVIETENILADRGEGFDVNQEYTYEKTPSAFDRSIEPPYGPRPEVKVPEVWEGTTSNGIPVRGIVNTEVPVVQFSIIIKGGQLLDDINKPGIAGMTAGMLNRGTAGRTPAELEEAIQNLGADIRISSGTESVRVSGSTLSRNYSATIDLVTEMLLEPRWDSAEFELLKMSTISSLRQQQSNPGSVASNQFRTLIYGEGSILGSNPDGTIESVESIRLEDLQEYYNNNFSPTLASIQVVGDITRKEAVAAFRDLGSGWKAKEVIVPAVELPSPPEKSTIYFYDIPGAGQSVFYVGYLALAETDADYYPATVMNYILGGGGFASRFTQVLRQEKGYTYGIRSAYSGSTMRGPFSISSNVKTSITLEALSLVKEIMEEYPSTYTAEDLEVTKSFILKSGARAFETPYAKLGMLETLAEYGWDPGYIKEREQVVEAMTVERISELASKYADPGRMIWVVVGDAASQAERLKELGFGEIVLVR